jgi:hypothetical protein
LAVLAWQALAPISPIAELPTHTPSLQPARMELPVYRPPLEASLAIINARPLFDPARQPVEEPAESGTQSLSPPDVTLVGVLIAAQNSLALLKEPAARAAVSLRRGESFQGWTLMRIERGFVVLKANEREFTVKLRAAAGLPQPPLNNVSSPVVTGQPGR